MVSAASDRPRICFSDCHSSNHRDRGDFRVTLCAGELAYLQNCLVSLSLFGGGGGGAHPDVRALDRFWVWLETAVSCFRRYPLLAVRMDAETGCR